MIFAAVLLLLSGCAAPPFTTAATTTAATTTDATTTGNQERVAIRIAALKGPTGMGLAGLMEDQSLQKTQNDYSFLLTGTPDDIVAKITSGQVDIAALPTNLAAVLYQKSKQEIKLLSVNTLGVLYILERGDQVHQLADLAGRDLQATGQGAVPEYVLDSLLAKGGLSEPVKVTYLAEHSELATLAVAGQTDLVMLPEPFVTTVLAKNPEMRLALDLTAEWKRANADKGSGELAMGCLVVRSSFAEQHPQAIQTFLDEYQSSTDFVNQEPAAAGQLIAKYEVLADAKLAERAIPNCHIVNIHGADMQPTLEPLFELLLAAKPESIGGKLPDDEFYFTP